MDSDSGGFTGEFLQIENRDAAGLLDPGSIDDHMTAPDKAIKLHLDGAHHVTRAIVFAHADIV